ncbi:MAG: indole-3-glycerol phosphate synthase [Francisellaceae bacterium]|jgi:indole-3-glycerol phosphate synthase
MVLDEIIKQKKIEIESLPDFNIDDLPRSQKNFISAIKEKNKAIIAELKAKSPSEGTICYNYDPVAIAQEYETGGVAAISVLTDQNFFAGSFSDLYKVSQSSSVPLLCKDFIIDKKQLYQARQHGADACLLIVRVLSDEQLKELNQVIEKLGMVSLVEIFDEADLQRALKISPKMIGINNRCLNTLVMDLGNAERLKPLIPKSILTLSLSGAKTPEAASEIAHKFDAVLMGTSLMRSDSRIEFIQNILI